MSAGLTARVLLGAALLGAAGDYLLRAMPWGMGFTAWTVLWLAFYTALLWHRDRRLRPSVAAFLVLATFFGACVAWRDAEVLTGWNVLGVLLCVGVAIVAMHGEALTTAPLARYVRHLLWAVGNSVTGAAALGLVQTERLQLRSRPVSRRWRATVIGFAMSLPLLLLFGALLGSADPLFERMLGSLVHWDLRRLAGHVALFGIVAWLVAGVARALLASAPNQALVTQGQPALGTVEIAIPLGFLAALFLAFDVVQARSLFGGDAFIRATLGVSYAEYAREGFFQLVAVSGLILPVLLGADWLHAADDRQGTVFVRFLTALVLVLIGLILASAAWRMRLYINAYGLTVDRVYATAVMVWIAATLIWFAVTVLRGRCTRFAFGGVVSGLATLALVNFLNPEGLVASVNTRRAATHAIALDTGYLARLGADAVPTLVASLDGLDLAASCSILSEIESRHVEWERSSGDWRTWNVARGKASRALSSVTDRACSPRTRQ